LASLVIASVEGAVAMCRALQDIAPFDQVAVQLLKAATRP
ncbi:TetR family transcriptional regulator, partial [Stenotrophomonas maltophilia]